MKRLLFAILTTISINSIGQQWIDYRVDSTLTITIPDNFETTDTLGQRLITAQVDNGLILITVLENKGKAAINIQNEKELIDSYRGFQKGAINSQKGALINDEIVEMHGIKFIRFSFRATMEGEKQIRHCLTVFANNRIYSINFWELESMTDEMISTREKLFASIKLPTNLSIKNQISYSIKGSPAYNISYFIGQVVGYVLIVAVLISIIVWISKKRRRKNTDVKQ